MWPKLERNISWRILKYPLQFWRNIHRGHGSAMSEVLSDERWKEWWHFKNFDKLLSLKIMTFRSTIIFQFKYHTQPVKTTLDNWLFSVMNFLHFVSFVARSYLSYHLLFITNERILLWQKNFNLNAHCVWCFFYKGVKWKGYSNNLCELWRFFLVWSSNDKNLDGNPESVPWRLQSIRQWLENKWAT